MTHVIREAIVFGPRFPYPEPVAQADDAAPQSPTNIDANTRLLRQRIRDTEEVPALTRFRRWLRRSARPSGQQFPEVGRQFGSAGARC